MSLGVGDLGRLAIASLQSNRLRTCLTATGVFLGVAAASTTLQVQHITALKLKARLAEREAPHVRAWVFSKGRLADLSAIAQQFPAVQAVSGAIPLWGGEAIYRDRRRSVQGQAVTLSYFATTGRQILPGQGRPLLAVDFETYSNTVVIDTVLAAQLFEDENPIEKVFYVRGVPYRVVGVMAAKSQEYSNPEQPVGEFVLPIATQMALTGSQAVEQIAVRPRDPEALSTLEPQLKTFLQQRFPEFTQPPWAQFDLPYTGSNVEDIQAAQRTLRTATRSLLLVGAIALGIAGVGIANITVASTLERTREIGLRLAIGATAQEILLQFLLESVLISLIGGLSAIAAVESVTWLLTQQERFDLPAYQFSGQNSAIALSAALAVGLSSSFIPAWRASRLDPVKALRS